MKILKKIHKKRVEWLQNTRIFYDALDDYQFEQNIRKWGDDLIKMLAKMNFSKYADINLGEPNCHKDDIYKKITDIWGIGNNSYCTLKEKLMVVCDEFDYRDQSRTSATISVMLAKSNLDLYYKIDPSVLDKIVFLTQSQMNDILNIIISIENRLNSFNSLKNWVADRF